MKSLLELKSICQFKKKKKEENKLVLLVKSKLNTIKVLISKVLIDSCNCHDEFVPVNN